MVICCCLVLDDSQLAFVSLAMIEILLRLVSMCTLRADTMHTSQYTWLPCCLNRASSNISDVCTALECVHWLSKDSDSHV